MPKIAVTIDWDDAFDSTHQYGIIGPDEDGGGWVAYVPGRLPCICDTLAGATAVLADSLRRKGARHARK
jgi:hypothetical protein